MMRQPDEDQDVFIVEGLTGNAPALANFHRQVDKYQQLMADREAERPAWEQQRTAGQAQERALVEQQGGERDKLESALKAADARCSQRDGLPRLRVGERHRSLG